MSVERKAPVRCAVYTRKSSEEERLEQSFNSLDAQREACHAYILSQRQEGWRAIDAQYDDGGYAGGTMERPGVRRLFEDIRAGKVDVIVVYKVDRLTRSLADFSKMIEILVIRERAFSQVSRDASASACEHPLKECFTLVGEQRSNRGITVFETNTKTSKHQSLRDHRKKFFHRLVLDTSL
jgi:site-specific DNA recombinase